MRPVRHAFTLYPRGHGTAACGGFTTIELLVVLSVILVLMGLLIPAIAMVRERARRTATAFRIQQHQGAFTQLGQGGGGATMALQRRADIGGVISFTLDDDNLLVPLVGDRLDYTARYGDMVTHGWQLRFPLGELRPFLSVAIESKWQFRAQPDLYAPEDFRLAWMRPIRTRELLQAIDVLPTDDAAAAAAYAHDRSPDRGWNDAWGSPLVIGYALYQYGLLNDPWYYDNIDGSAREGLQPYRLWEPVGYDTQHYVNRATYMVEHYGYDRATYLAFGAPGTSIDDHVALATGLTDDPDATLRALWDATLLVADPEVDWRIEMSDPSAGTNAMTDPPWQGVRAERVDGRTAMVSQPAVVH